MNKVNLQKKVRKSYIKRVWFHSIILLLFLSSSLIFAGIGKDIATPYPKELSQNGLTLTYVEGGYDTKTSRAFVVFNVPYDELDLTEKFEILAKVDKVGNPLLKSEVVKVQEDLYVGYVEVSRTGWKKMLVEVIQTSEDNDEDISDTNERIYFHQNTIKEKEINPTDLKVSYYKTKISRVETSIKESLSDKKTLEKSIADLAISKKGLEESKAESSQSEQEAISNKLQEVTRLIDEKLLEVEQIDKAILEHEESINTFKTNINAINS